MIAEAKHPSERESGARHSGIAALPHAAGASDIHASLSGDRQSRADLARANMRFGAQQLWKPLIVLILLFFFFSCP
jgi:hypothetical protein